MTSDQTPGDQSQDNPGNGAPIPGARPQGQPTPGNPATRGVVQAAPSQGGAPRGAAPAGPVQGGPMQGNPTQRGATSGGPSSTGVGQATAGTPDPVGPNVGGATAGTRPTFGQGPARAAAPNTSLPPESRAARSLTDRSKVEGGSSDEPLAQSEPAQLEAERGPRVWPRVVGVGILLLAVAGAWVWQNPGFIQHTMGSLFPGSTSHDADAAAIQTLDARVTRLEQRPPPDLTALTQRLDALEQRLTPTAQPAGSNPPAQAAVDLHPVLSRLDALEARAKTPSPGSLAPSAQTGSGQNAATPVGPDLTPLYARIDALAQTVAERTVDPSKVAALTAQVQALSTHDPDTELRGKLDQVEHQLSGLSASEAKLSASSERTARVARLEAAETALASGRPLGAIPNAPPALARFATAAPPTQAALRLAFPAAASAALKVSQPDTDGKSFLDGIIARLQDSRLITVRQGDHVLVGSAAAATLAQAQMLLEAGDLAGAAREVASLTGPPAEKMAPWLADANALLAAREALATLAEQG
jgi:hypothetical protein